MFKLLRMPRCCTPAVFDGLIDLFRFAKNTGCDVAEQSTRPPEPGFEFRAVLLNCRKHFSHISPERLQVSGIETIGGLQGFQGSPARIHAKHANPQKQSGTAAALGWTNVVRGRIGALSSCLLGLVSRK